MVLTIKKSLCPLILGVERVKASINGKPYLFNNPLLNAEIERNLKLNNYSGIK